MEIQEYLDSGVKFTPAVVGFLIKDNKILLGLRKKVSLGLGENLISGIGGKIGDKLEIKNENASEALIREFKEEIKITPKKFEDFGEVSFIFPHNPKWNQKVKIFLIYSWTGKESETEAIKPMWFEQKKLPVERMWKDNAVWLPQVLSGKKINSIFLLDENNKVIEEKKIKVYYSGSIKGVPEADPDFPQKLVKFIENCGAEVLSEHVAFSNKEKSNEIFFQKTGINLDKISPNLLPEIIRKQDINWVDEAEVMIALVNSPSLGVGVEIQRALDKEKLGMRKTPILCLIRDDLKDKLSFMISGINLEETDVFYLRSYKDLEEAQKHIFDFLGKNRL